MKQLLLSILLCLTLLLGGKTTSIAQTPTAPTAGDGLSPVTAYQISSLNNLYWLATQVNAGTDFSGKYFKQTADIDASPTSTWDSGKGWMPIGYDKDGGFNTYYYFSGNYDGQNYTISNLHMNRSPFLCGGLFGITFGATISNVGLSNVSLTASTGTSTNQWLGALIGYAYQSTIIDNCYATGNISGDTNTGGLIGSLDGAGGDNSLSNSFFSGTVSAKYSAGGLCADASSGNSITQCYSAGSVTCTTYYTGGLIGNCGGTVSNSYSMSTVNGGQYSGGLIGAGYNTAILNYCYATGAVSGTSGVGGLIGYNFSAPTLTGCFWDTQTSGQSASADGTGKTTAEMKTTSTFTGWDFVGETANGTNDYWNRMDTKNNKYPYLEWQVLPFTAAVSTTAISTYDVTSATMGGNITADGGATVTERGVVYSSTDATPTIGETGVTKDANGTGIGTFSKSITGLSGNTTYNVCAYATNSAGTSYGMVTNFTTLVAVPTVTGISPTSGSTAGGTSVTITGTNLSAASAVNFGGTAGSITANNATSITATSPAGSAGAVDVTVTTDGGTSATSIADQFTYVAAPNISYTTPKTYTVGTAITAIAPVNTGGTSTGVGNALVVTTLAGSGASGFLNGNASTASFTAIWGIARDTHGNTFVCDYLNNAIRKIASDGAVSTFAGGTSGSADGIGTVAQFKGPIGLAIDASGTLYVGDEQNSSIRKITTEGVVSTFCTGIANPSGITFDETGNVFVASYGSSVIYKITPAGVKSVFAGKANNAGYLDATGSSARFNWPFGIVTDALGNFYVSDYNNNVIRKITSAGVVTTFAGSGIVGSADGTGTAASFYQPDGLSIDNSGNIYVADRGNNKIRKITSAGVVTTIAGSGDSGSLDGNATSATFNGMRDINVSTTGEIYVSDNGNRKIRKVSPALYSISPSLPAGLRFDGLTGIISGNPTAPSPSTNYTISAANVAGTSTTILNITVASAPTATTSAATSVTGAEATLNGTINANNSSTAVTFEYGLTTSYGTTVTATQSPVTESTATAVSYALSGLTPNTKYHFRVNGVNSAGTTTGTDKTFTTLDIAPNSPTIGTATAENGQASVSFTAPVSNGGSAISGYTVTSNPGGFTGTGTTSPIAVTGLTNGTAYTFTVTATNGVGTGAASAASNSVTPLVTPTITGISPSSGPIVGGTSVVITGTGFSDATSVKFGSSAANITANTATSITAVSPAGSVETIHVTVTTAGGTSDTNTSDKFTYFGAPTFTSTPAVITVDYGKKYSYSALATKEGNLPTTITAPTLPTWMSFSSSVANKATLFGSFSGSVNGLAEDNAGNIYGITYDGLTIYKMTPDGVSATWKTGMPTGNQVYSLYIAGGYIYIPYYRNLSNIAVARIPLNDPTASLETFATSSNLYGAWSLEEHNGYIYIANLENTQILRVNENSKVSEVVLNQATGIPPNGCGGLTFDASGNMYIATYNNRTILKYDGTKITTVLSGLTNVSGIRADNEGNFYVSSTASGLRKYTADFSSYQVVSLAGDESIPSFSYSSTGGVAYSVSNRVYRLQTGATITGTPAKSDVGSHNVVLRATNIAGYTDQTFTINVVDNVAPVVSTYSPVTNATNIDLKPTLSLTFDEKVSLGSTGILSIYNGATLVKSYDLSVAADKVLFALSSDQKSVSITLTENLPVNTLVTVGISAGFVKDQSSNAFLGFAASSNTWKFTTQNKVTPTVTTQAVSAIGGTTATGNGNITSLGVPNPSQYGVVWSTSTNPTIALPTKTTLGAISTAVPFTSDMTGLTKGTTYYVKAYATNSVDTSYGDEVNFTTAIFEGLGTDSNPYQIATLADLRLLSENSSLWNKSFIQTADIDASTTSSWNSPAGFSPIGNGTIKFTGKYNGQQHIVSGLFINRPGTDFVGLFGFVTTGTIQNLGLPNVNIKGHDYAGGLAGSIRASSTISNCFSTGSVTGNILVAGITGSSESSTITNSYSKVNVTGNDYVAGLVGYNFRTIASAINPIETNCYSTGTVSGATNLGGLNSNNDGTVTNCFWNTQTSGRATSVGGTGKTTIEMNTQSTFTGWDFTGETANGTNDYWSIDATKNNGYPYLSWQILPVTPTTATAAVTTFNATSATLGGNITSDGGATVTERGVVYSLTDATPTIAEGATKVDIGSGSGIFSQSVGSLNAGTLYYVNAYATNTAGTSYGTATSFTTLIPSITSSTYNSATGLLSLTCQNIATGETINPAKITLTGEGGSTYTLTTGNVTASSSTSASITLNAADLNAVNMMLNKNGTSSTGGTTYNLAVADDWDASVTSANSADAINSVTVSNVSVPTIASATYDAANGNLVVSGTGFVKLAGAANDIDVSKFTITGEGGATYALTSASVEITSGSAFTVSLNSTDIANLNLIVNKNGTSSTGGTTYNLAVAEDWANGADAAVVVADLTGNGVTVSNVAVPTITSATYDAATGNLVVSGTGFLKLAGAANDIDVSKLTFSGEGSLTRVLTSSSVEITSATSFSVTLNATDITNLNQVINNNGTSSAGAVLYNLIAAEDWAAGADPSAVVADLTGNGITVSNAILPVEVSSTSGFTGATQYGNLKNAFDAINSGTHTGAVTIKVTGSTTELTTATIYQNGYNSTSSYTSINIYPTVTGLSISGNINGAPLIDLNGATNVTINGSTGGTATTKDLTISNTHTGATATINLINGASDNTVKNCILTGVQTAGTGSVVCFSTAGTTGNNNNLIQNNDITKGTSIPTLGIYNLGTAGKPNSNNQILANRITDFGFTAIRIENYSTGNTYKNNEIYLNSTLSGNVYGVVLNNSTISGEKILANNIHDLSTNATAVGIFLAQNSSTPSLVANNFINMSGAASSIIGIYDNSGTSAAFNIYNNTVVVSGTGSGTNTSSCYYRNQNSVSNIKNNLFVNKRTVGTGTHYVVRYSSSATGNLSSDYNNYYSSGGTNSTLGKIDATDYANLTNWKAASGKDDHTLSINPSFVSDSDLHLSTVGNDALAAAGTDLSSQGITTDIDNKTRNALPCIGAHELNVQVINISSSLTAFTSTYGSVSTEQQYTIDASPLSDVLTITAPTDFAVSTDGVNYSNTLTLSPYNGIVSSTTIYVRVNANATAGKPTGIITHVSTNATQQNVSVTGTVSRKELTVSQVTADSKVYNGNTSAKLNVGPLSGVLFNDDVSLALGTGSFSDINAENGKTVTLTSFSLSGTKAGNYSLTQPTNPTADITKLDVSGVFSASSKNYDGNNTAIISSRSLVGVLVPDIASVNLSGGTATFSDALAGDHKVVTGSGMSLSGSAALNYNLTDVATTTANISKSNVSGTFTVADKTYDGNNAAIISSRSLVGVLAADIASVNLIEGTATFSDALAGKNKVVTGSGMALSGSAASNYNLTDIAPTTANITKLDVSGVFTANSKNYDGNNIATINSRSLTGLLNSDITSVNLSGGTATFSDALAGKNKIVTGSGMALTGNAASNYNLINVATTSANILPKELTISNAIAQNKIYDGNNTAQIYGASLIGVIGSDDVTLANQTTGTFSQLGVGTNIAVSTSPMTISGADRENYILIQPANLKAIISKKGLIITAKDKTKCFGETLTIPGTDFTNTALVAGDVISSVSFASLGFAANAASGRYDILPSNAIGNGLENYEITYINGALPVYDLPVPTITGMTSVCPGITSQTYRTESGMNNYNWTVSNGGTITAGQGTNEVTITWNADNPQTVSVNYSNANSCSNTGTIGVTFRSATFVSASANTQTLCYGSNGITLTSTVSSDPNNSIGYLWEISKNNNNWLAIDEAKSPTYSPGILNETTYYRVAIVTNCGGQRSNELKITVLAPTTTPVVSAAQTICYGSTPSQLISTPVTGGSGSFIYQWQKKTTGSWTNVGNGNLSYQPEALTETTLFRMVATDKETTSCGSILSNEITITVKSVTLPGTIAADQKIAPGSKPAPIISVAAGSGDGTISYTWESSVDKGLNWSAITNQNGSGYAPGVENSESWYRRITISTDQSVVCSAASTPVRITTWGTGINETTQEALSAYAVRNIEIKVKGQVSAKAIAFLYDIQGKLLITKKMEEGCLNTIETSNIKPGVYMLLVKDADKAQSFKLMMME